MPPSIRRIDFRNAALFYRQDIVDLGNGEASSPRPHPRPPFPSHELRLTMHSTIDIVLFARAHIQLERVK